MADKRTTSTTRRSPPKPDPRPTRRKRALQDAFEAGLRAGRAVAAEEGLDDDETDGAEDDHDTDE